MVGLLIFLHSEKRSEGAADSVPYPGCHTQGCWGAGCSAGSSRLLTEAVLDLGGQKKKEMIALGSDEQIGHHTTVWHG